MKYHVFRYQARHRHKACFCAINRFVCQNAVIIRGPREIGRCINREIGKLALKPFEFALYFADRNARNCPVSILHAFLAWRLRMHQSAYNNVMVLHRYRLDDWRYPSLHDIAGRVVTL